MVNKDVFISYKVEDTAEALWVKTTLEQNGISCRMAPSSIPGISSYAEAEKWQRLAKEQGVTEYIDYYCR